LRPFNIFSALAYGYDEEKFLIHDPTNKFSSISKRTLVGFYDLYEVVSKEIMSEY
jgi:hypothetical protein